MTQAQPHSRRTALAALAATLVLAGCSSSPADSASGSGAATRRSVTDTTGAQVELPGTVNRVADAWQAHNEVVAMLGAGDKVVATVSTKELVPWLYTVNPHMNDAKTVFTNTTADVEGLLATKPDVIFMPTNSKVADSLKDVKVPVVQLNFTDYDGLKKVVTITGDALGGSASDKAKEYNQHLTDTLAAIEGKTKALTDAQRPKVLHVTSLKPLIVDGTDTIIDAWIRATGGRNAADVKGNNVTVGTEQLVAWNPDVVILGSNTLVDRKDPNKAVTNLLADPNWANMAAAKSKKVHLNPIGAFFWDRYSAEGVLQLQWTAKLLHPELFGDVDVEGATRSFYKTYFNVDLTGDQVRKILTATLP